MKIIKWPRWYVFLSILFVIIFFIYHFESPLKIRNEKFRRDLKLSFNGIVIDKFVDSVNHNYKTILIKENLDTTRFIFDFDRTNTFHYIKTGDSIIKDKGDSAILIIRNKNRKEFTLKY